MLSAAARRVIVIWLLIAGSAQAQEMSPVRYEIGSPVLTDIWVDAASGRDTGSGFSRAEALQSLSEAWRRIPQGVELSSTGYRIMLLPGDYTDVPAYMERRYGTRERPIIVQGADGTPTIRVGLNVFDVRYLYIIGVNIIPDPAGDAFHCERCDHVLLRAMELSGGSRIAQETVKFNQSAHVYVEDCDIHGGWDNAFDCVGVQFGHLYRNKIHDAGDWCGYVKGGSAYFRVEGNEFFNCGTGGFSAGQGSGLEFMVPPWLHYEAYDVKVVNNTIHDTWGAGLGVNGGYNILLAYNTLYRVGERSHGIEIVFGYRSCDGNTARCADYLSGGAWGRLDSVGELPLGNRNVYVYNNVLYNPPGYRSADTHFAIYGPRIVGAGTNIPSPVRTDVNLQIRGNLIWNGPSDLPLGVEGGEGGCADGNPSCNEAQLRAENSINSVVPALIDPESGDFRPVEGGSVLTQGAYAIPAFPGGDRETRPLAPQGVLTNDVPRDRQGISRALNPGAYSGPLRPRRPADMYLPWNGYLGMINIVELVNGSADATAVDLALYNSSGESVSLVRVPVAAGGQRDVILNELPGFQEDSYGLVTLDFVGPPVTGRASFYHNRRGASERFDFAYAVPFSSPSASTTFLPFNTYQPSARPDERDYQVANWLTVSNLDSSAAKTFRLYRHAENGDVLSTEEFTIGPFGRMDREAGHVIPGPFRTGLNRLVPNDLASPYLAQLVRYGGNARAGTPVLDYSFAYPVFALVGGPQEQHVPISTGGSAINWLEVLNLSALPLNLDLTLNGADGQSLTPLPLRRTVPPFGQTHFNAGELLGPDASGSVSLSGERAGALAAYSMYYFRRADESISSMYGLPAGPPRHIKERGIIQPVSRDV